MSDSIPIPLTEENLPAMMDKHREKIDRAIGYDSDTQTKRLKLFERDPEAIAAHYPELQAKSEELRQSNLAVQKTAATVGWLSAAATAAATGYQVHKKKFGSNKLIQGIMVTFSAITAGLAGNFITEKLLGGRIREESADLANASRKALEREYAPNMEDTEQKIAARLAVEQQKTPVAQQPPEEPQKKWANAEASTSKQDEGHAAAVAATRAQESTQPARV